MQVTGEVIESTTLTFLFKPLLMPLLLLWYLYSIEKKALKKGLVIALIFSFFGDTFLLFVYRNEAFFLLGLGSFLVAQLSYVYLFFKDKQKGKLPLGFAIGSLSFFSFFVGLLLLVIYDDLNDLLLPVIVYAIAVGLMGVAASFRYQSVNNTSFIYVFLGAFLFVISDTVIALNKFLFNGQMLLSGFIIMSLYITGQYFIVKGIIKEAVA